MTLIRFDRSIVPDSTRQPAIVPRRLIWNVCSTTSAARHHLLAFRREQTFEASLDRFGHFVNDLEPPDIDAVPFSHGAGPFFGHDVERDDDRPRSLGQSDVALVHAADPLVHDRHAHFGM